MRRFTLGLLNGVVSDVLQFTLDATLAVSLHTRFGYSTHTIGLFFCCMMGGAFLTSALALRFP